MEILIGIISGQRSYALGLIASGALQMVGSGCVTGKPWCRRCHMAQKSQIVSYILSGFPRYFAIRLLLDLSATRVAFVICLCRMQQETSFEEALTDKLDGRSRCKLFAFDPSVEGFPNQKIKGEKHFNKVALASKSDARPHDGWWEINIWELISFADQQPTLSFEFVCLFVCLLCFL